MTESIVLLASILLAAAGSCTPLYSTPGVAQDEGAIYFTAAYVIVRGPEGFHLARDDYRTLLRQSKADQGVTPVIHAEGGIGAIDIDGPFLWYGATTCDLDGCPLELQSTRLQMVTTTGGAPAVLVDKTPPIHQILHDSTRIYWRELVRTGPTDQLFASRIRSYDKQTGEVATLLDDGQLYVDMVLTDDSSFLVLRRRQCPEDGRNRAGGAREPRVIPAVLPERQRRLLRLRQPHLHAPAR